MGWFQQLFKHTRQEPAPAPAPQDAPPAQPHHHGLEGLEHIRFGRYSDNNKTLKQQQTWLEADQLFRDKKYPEYLRAVFEYLKDPQLDNVQFRAEGAKAEFTITQGSRKIEGRSDGKDIWAHTGLAVMEKPLTAVMRRLLDLNFSLLYSYCAMSDDRQLCMKFHSDLASANPTKMYQGLRELSTKADRQDDLLLADFPELKPLESAHLNRIPDEEFAVKYRYLQQWITEVLDLVKDFNQDSFSGAIAYLLLMLIYRIDFLLIPEGKLLAEFERINKIYWEKKEELTLVERNRMMREALAALAAQPGGQYREDVFRPCATFSISSTPSQDKIRENVSNANRDSVWYVENKYPETALLINEYGLLYNQYVYSMPQVQTELATIYMAVLHDDFFQDLGLRHRLCDPESKKPIKAEIADAVDEIVERHREKYPHLRWDHERINYSNRYEFGISFSDHLCHLNLDLKRQTI